MATSIIKDIRNWVAISSHLGPLPVHQQKCPREPRRQSSLLSDQLPEWTEKSLWCLLHIAHIAGHHDWSFTRVDKEQYSPKDRCQLAKDGESSKFLNWNFYVLKHQNHQNCKVQTLYPCNSYNTMCNADYSSLQRDSRKWQVSTKWAFSCCMQGVAIFYTCNSCRMEVRKNVQITALAISILIFSCKSWSCIRGSEEGHGKGKLYLREPQTGLLSICWGKIPDLGWIEAIVHQSEPMTPLGLVPAQQQGDNLHDNNGIRIVQYITAGRWAKKFGNLHYEHYYVKLSAASQGGSQQETLLCAQLSIA